MANRLGNQDRGDLANNATTVIKAFPGYFGKLVMTNVGTAATVDVYDNATTGSGVKLWSWVTADGKGVFEFFARAKAGITVVVNNGGTVAGYITYD